MDVFEHLLGVAHCRDLTQFFLVATLEFVPIGLFYLVHHVHFALLIHHLLLRTLLLIYLSLMRDRGASATVRDCDRVLILLFLFTWFFQINPHFDGLVLRLRTADASHSSFNILLRSNNHK